MERLPPFFLNKSVVGPTALRLFLLFYQSAKSYPNRRSHRFTRESLSDITKCSYGNIAEALKELILLKIIILDVFDLTKTHFIVCDPKDYNWEEIRKRLSLNFEGVPKSAEDFSGNQDSD